MHLEQHYNTLHVVQFLSERNICFKLLKRDVHKHEGNIKTLLPSYSKDFTSIEESFLKLR
jgi:hypothetical protein